MSPEVIIGDRFVIETPVASGGMGSIFRALDRATGELVAIKLVDHLDDDRRRRFLQEAEVLSGLRHPAIVRYIAHGEAASGRPFLAMEWLRGEDLATRLRKQRLSVEETLLMIRRVCEGLSSAHERGVVHRDLKPSNIFLCDSNPVTAKLIDFGIARFAPRLTTLTQIGSIVGTIGYMSPEQARSEPDVDERTDVFALGCVLFECVTGDAPFSGADAVAVLAKVLCDEPPSLRDIQPELPGSLSFLVSRMLSKEPTDRPRDAQQVIFEIDSLSTKVAPSPSRPTMHSIRPSVLTAAEQRISSVMLLSPVPRVERSVTSSSDSEASKGRDLDISTLKQELQKVDAEVAELANGTVLVSCTVRGNAVDTLAHVATAGLAFRETSSKWRVALATGRADSTARARLGTVIDRAVSLLRDQRFAGARDGAGSAHPHESVAGAPPSGVFLDEVTATLLANRFDIEQRAGRHIAVAARMRGEGAKLLGRPAPFVGRERELALLEATLVECVDDSVARTVMVTGPAGIGKSRLMYEFLQRVQGRMRVFMARGEPVAAGSAFAVARGLVRMAIGLTDGQLDSSALARLRRYLSRYFRKESLAMTVGFLAELLGVEAPENTVPELGLARSEPRVMAEWLKRTFEDWLSAEVHAKPVLVVLDDLHWADAPSVELIADVARKLEEQPFMILGLARSDGEGPVTFWPGRGRLSIEIEPLTKRAAERLVLQAAPGSITPDQITAIVARADGNPFFIEELIRASVRGQLESLPDTVLAIVEARLSLLEPEARRVLRAASIFGETFWESAVMELLSEPSSKFDPEWLAVLVDRELIEPNRRGQESFGREYRFLHGLVRDAAYAMLTDADREAGHRLAAEWLERFSDSDPLVIAEHFTSGAAHPRAIPYFVKAAEAAYRATNLPSAAALAERGLAAGARGTLRGMLRAIAAWALTWTGEWQKVYGFAFEAVELLPVGSTNWIRAATTLVYSASSLGEAPSKLPVVQSLLAASPPATGPYGEALLLLFSACYELGERDLSLEFMRRFEPKARNASPPDLAFSAWAQLSRAHHEVRNDEPGRALERIVNATATFEKLRDHVGRTMAAFYETATYFELGCIEEADAAARLVMDLSQRYGLAQIARWGTINMASSHLLHGRPQNAIELAAPLENVPDQPIAQNARMLLAIARRGSHAETMESARGLLDGTLVPNVHASAHASMARVALKQGDYEQALAAADAGLALHRDLGATSRVASVLRLIRVHALLGLGDFVRADEELRYAVARISAVAESLQDAALANSYIQNVEANKRTLALAKERLPSFAARPSFAK